MRQFFAVLLVCSLFAQAQTNTPSAAPSAQVTTPAQLMAFGLEDGTPVKLRLSRTISSATEHQGDTVDFEVLDQVMIGDLVVIPVGSVALATVTEVEKKKRMGRGGKLNVTLDSVRLVNGQKAALRAVQGGNAGGHVGAMTGAIVATAIVLWPAAPFFLFMHGKDLTIPKGTLITAYINGNIPLERAAFEPKKPEAPAADATITVAAITSTPDAADVDVDGSFVGNTPASVNLAPGDHTVSVHKKGFAEWQRKLKATGGSVRLNAELETAAATDPAKPADPTASQEQPK